MNQQVGRVPSSRGNGVEYVLMRTDGGSIICGCPGFGYRRKCRHVDEWHAAHPEGVRVVLNGEDLVGAGVAGGECALSRDGKHLMWMRGDVRQCWWCKEVCCE